MFDWLWWNYNSVLENIDMLTAMPVTLHWMGYFVSGIVIISRKQYVWLPMPLFVYICRKFVHRVCSYV